MNTKLKIALLASVSLSLAGCGAGWRLEAGTAVDEGQFGNPTMNNTLVQTGDMVIDLNARFASAVPTMVNFEFDRTGLDEAARSTLRQQAGWIKGFPEVRFRVYGHTDLVGSPAYNKSLGQRRAQTVVNYLVSQGVERSRLEAVASFGETQPLIATSDRERRNRRTVTEVSGFVNRAPDPLDGKYGAVIREGYIRSGIELPPTTSSLGRIEGQGGS
jgi:outer membrane protein OmpA-like peptidoglycan-associated protein